MIMFKVGMGGKPSIPEHLSEEGKDFMLHCLESDPHHRWTASQLQDHAFVKVNLVSLMTKLKMILKSLSFVFMDSVV